MIGLHQTVLDSDEAYRKTLSDVMERGTEIEAGESQSVGSNRKSKELLDYTLIWQNPRERLLWNPRKRLSLPGAVARFVWMMAANDRLKDIEFYWGPKVTPFSDDGVLVIGSNYGQRMLNPRPGVNQVEAIINRLAEDRATRRAAISIYQAEDSVRQSHDIPCAFGLMFHLRGGMLHSSVVMRSNNAFILMPYNLFEFSLLAEAVAAQLKVGLGSIFYLAASMHIYEENYQQALDIVKSVDEIKRKAVMPQMPEEPSPIQQIRELVKLEADARHAAAGFSSQNFDEWLRLAETRLAPYWRQLFCLLLLDMAQKRKLEYALTKLSAVMDSPWKEYLPPQAFESAPPSVSGQTTLFPEQRHGPVEVSVRGPLTSKRLASFESLCEAKSEMLRAEGNPVIDFVEYKKLRNSLVGDLADPVALAARDLDTNISSEEFEKAFLKLRADGSASTKH